MRRGSKTPGGGESTGGGLGGLLRGTNCKIKNSNTLNTMKLTSPNSFGESNSQRRDKHQKGQTKNWAIIKSLHDKKK